MLFRFPNVGVLLGAKNVLPHEIIDLRRKRPPLSRSGQQQKTYPASRSQEQGYYPIPAIVEAIRPDSKMR